MASPTSRRWTLAAKPTGLPVMSGPDATFKLEANPLPALGDDQVLLKIKYLSNDPAQRLWMDPNIVPDRLYVDPVELGDTMKAISSISEVIESKSAELPVGTLVSCETGWAEHVVVDAKICVPLKLIDDLSPTHYAGAFGIPGITAYHALVDIVQAGPNDTVVISAAAGGVGSVAVQVAKKILGCRRVVGIAGTDAKCRWVESLGADVCVNYKSAGFREALADATQGYVDVFLDNVGGEILDVMLTRMNKFGRVAAIGAIADYNSGANLTGIKNWYDVIAMRLQIRGFVLLDLTPARWAEIIGILVRGYEEGNIKVTDEGQTIVPAAFEDVPRTWLKLFEGHGTGKLLTQLL